MSESLTSIKVAVVEDHPEFRDALCRALADGPGAIQVDVAKDLPAGLRLLAHECPDVLLVDLGLPSGSGMALIREARRRWGERCTSAVLTVTGNEEHLLTAVGAGAKGYLFKSDQCEAWRQVVHDLASGYSPLHAQLAGHFLQQFNPPSSADEALLQGLGPAPSTLDLCTHSLLQYVAAGYTVIEAAAHMALTLAEAGTRLRAVYDALQHKGPELSVRELELLTLLNKGFPFRKCAELMGVSESTTKTQANSAYHKLGASNLQTALYEARAAGLLH